jgi:hypothetical protein
VISKFNPLQKTINKTHLRTRPNTGAPQTPKVQPLKLPLNSSKKLLTPGPLLSSKTKPTSENSGRLTSAPRDKEYKEFEENLPPNCYFKNETRAQLPRDPVKLIKLKLMKQKTEKNLKSELDRLSDQNRSRHSQSQIPRMKQTLARLDQTLLEKRGLLRKIREKYQNVSTAKVDSGRFY